MRTESRIHPSGTSSDGATSPLSVSSSHFGNLGIFLRVPSVWFLLSEHFATGFSEQATNASPALTEAVLRFFLWHTSQDWKERGLTRPCGKITSQTAALSGEKRHTSTPSCAQQTTKERKSFSASASATSFVGQKTQVGPDLGPNRKPGQQPSLPSS